MIAAIIAAVVIVVVMPVGFLMSTSLAAGVLGGLLKSSAEKTDPESELIANNY